MVLTLIVVGPRFPYALHFAYAYSQIREGMTMEQVDRVLAPWSRNEFYGKLLNASPPTGGFWICELGGTSDFNHIRVWLEDGRVVRKSLSWDT